MPEPTLELLQTLILRSLEGQTAIHREVGDVRTVLLALVDQGRRTERRVEEIRYNIELMVKAELMGRIGNFETRIGAQLEALAERVSSLEVRTPDAT
jgi:hypothetical protein